MERKTVDIEREIQSRSGVAARRPVRDESGPNARAERVVAIDNVAERLNLAKHKWRRNHQLDEVVSVIER
jgi:hypothetical protein